MTLYMSTWRCSSITGETSTVNRSSEKHPLDMLAEITERYPSDNWVLAWFAEVPEDLHSRNFFEQRSGIFAVCTDGRKA